MSPSPFRSVLPHEPPPSADEPGYLLLQGALQPRVEEESNNEDHSNETWTRNVLSARLTEVGFGVEVLDGTKLRLKLPTALDACRWVNWGRAHQISLADLWTMPLLSFNQQTEMTHLQNNVTLPTKALQWTLLTQQPLPTASWHRSSPPKFRRLLPRPDEDLEVLQATRATTRFLFVSHLVGSTHAYDDTDAVWTTPSAATQALRSVFNAYDTTGDGVEVFVAHANKRTQYCHVGFRNATDAQTALHALQEAVVTWQWTEPGPDHPTMGANTGTTMHTCQSGKLFLDYAAVTDRSQNRAQLRAVGADVPKGEPTHAECTSTTDHVHVPGLLVVPDFVSEAEEEVLLAFLLGPHAPWAPAQSTPTEGGIVKRRVQHYGYVFDYQTADVLRNKEATETANCPPLPQWDDDQSFSEKLLSEKVQEGRGWHVLAGICERIRQTTFTVDDQQSLQFPQINQMTLNHYDPGEGIGSHVDTVSAFGNGLMSLSLQSGIVMEFRKPASDNGSPAKRKLVYLPPRSLVVMSGPARYEWEHMIVTRRTDTHQGKVLPRGVRVSLTFRTALQEDGTPLPLLQSSDFPLRWGQDSLPKSAPLFTPECERSHVHKVYDAIAKQWHHTRGRRGVLWPGATQFLQRLPVGSMVADVGCGDGKYFPAIWKAGSFCIGTDISRPLLQTAFPNESDIPESCLPESRRISLDRIHLRKRPAVAVADCMNLPIRDHSCDAAICIAVLHHLSTHARRVQCLRELARVVRVGGLINVQAWALDQEEGSRRKFATEDVFVPFNAQPKYLDLQSSNGVKDESKVSEGRSTAQVYSEAFNAQYDDRKGLVVFKRYCHLYRQGELEELVNHVPNLELVEGGFESGNYFIILKVTAE